MSSILTNASALSALQSLTQTQAALKTTENQVSTGLAVSSAADNASYWSIATQLGADSGVVTSANSALSQSQAVLSTASSAINSVITTIKAIESALTTATNPGASITNLNTTLSQLGKQLTDAVSGASFNGLNILNGSVSTTQTDGTASLNFVAGFNATATGGSINTIGLTTQTLYAKTTPTASNSALVQTLATGAITDTNDTSSTSFDLTTYGGTGVVVASDGANAGDMLTAAEAAMSKVTSYAATIGATQDRMTAASTFNTALTTNYSTGISALVDADMNTASTRLQALQTQEQLGIQSLSIA
ncbi:MAG: flagellin, partial [Mycobacterium sp.]|nr:flagellin [Mycobacterium sp.]